MNKIIIPILLLILISAVKIFPQIQGVSKAGSLFPIKDKTSPNITVLQPPFSPDKDTITVERRIIELKIKITDESSIKNVLVNSDTVFNVRDSIYYYNEYLSEGKNIITILASDIYGNSSEKIIEINSTEDMTPPEILIFKPSKSKGIELVSKNSTIEVEGRAIDKSGISQIEVNGLKADVLTTGSFKKIISVEIGNNPINIRATDNFNNSSDTTINFPFGMNEFSQMIISYDRFIALVIGINSYGGYWHALENAVNDAKKIRDILRYDFKFDTVITLLDHHATRTNIIQQLERLVRNVNENDNVLIFYSGHSYYDSLMNKGYWVPIDAKTNSLSQYISNSEIKDYIQSIPAKHTLLIADACFAGDVFRGQATINLQRKLEDKSRYYSEKYRKKSRIALTSSDKEPATDSGYEGNSIFTFYLLKALKEIRKEHFEVADIYEEFKEAVYNNSRQNPRWGNLRDVMDEGGSFIFIRR